MESNETALAERPSRLFATRYDTDRGNTSGSREGKANSKNLIKTPFYYASSSMSFKTFPENFSRAKIILFKVLNKENVNHFFLQKCN